MSGHSKFANIKHKKEKNDAAKGKVFTIIGRVIHVELFFRLGNPVHPGNQKSVQRLEIFLRKRNPEAERGIKKAAGDVGNVTYEFVTYEGYGPNGIAIIVDALT